MIRQFGLVPVSWHLEKWIKCNTANLAKNWLNFYGYHHHLFALWHRKTVKRFLLLERGRHALSYYEALSKFWIIT